MPTIDQLAFYAACAVNFTDLLGISFVGPVLVPYGQSIGAEQNDLAMFQTIRFAGAFIANFWMPWMADKVGYKSVVIVSTIGTGASYMMQGMAHKLVEGDSKNGVYFMLAGRLVGGLFGGTQPVLRSFVTVLCMPDTQLLKYRLTILLASNQAAGMFLSPVAGAVSVWGLHLPWLISAVVAGLCLAVVVLWFVNPEKIKSDKKKKDEEEDPARIAVANEIPELPAFVGPSPFCDFRLLLQACGMFFIMMGVAGTILLMPLLLQFEDYDLIVMTTSAGGATTVDKMETLKAVANASGILAVPNGIVQLLTSTIIFLLLSKKIGDMPTMRIGMVLMTAALAMYGIGTSKFWHLLIVHGVSGIGMGLVMPAMAPKTAMYCKVAHSKKVATATALASLGMSLGFMAGPPVIMGLAGNGKDRDKINTTFLVAAALFGLGGFIVNLAVFFMMRHPALAATKRTPTEVAAAWRSNAKDESQFVDEMCDDLRAMLTKGSPQYRNWDGFHGVIQRMLRRALSDLMPVLPPYVEDDHGKDHFQPIWQWLQKYGTHEEQEGFIKHAANAGFLQHLDIDVELTSAPEVHMINEPVSETIKRDISFGSGNHKGAD